MNARSNLITALLTLSLILPAAAGAQIPGEPTTNTSKQPKVHLQILKANSSAIGTSATNNWAAYVHGGASMKVAKAITAAATGRATIASSAYNTWAPYVHGGSSQKVAKAITAAATGRTATRTASTCASDAQYRVPC